MTAPAVASKPAGNRFTRFFSGIWGEMKKVVWLSRREVTFLTLLVLGVSIIIGIILYGFDTGFSYLVEIFLVN
ncbi:MAG TPA: preprotein translocase subunit SecE [Dehalococcoidales bacterium]|nr:preprotein translocase subunit SecE [Dehalococcoidales bacterium]